MNKLKEKIKVDKMFESLYVDFFSGTPNEVISKINKKVTEAISKGYEDVYLSGVVDYDYSSVEVWGDRLETEEEFSARMNYIQNEEIKERRKEDSERKKYEELKKKFG